MNQLSVPRSHLYWLKVVGLGLITALAFQTVGNVQRVEASDGAGRTIEHHWDLLAENVTGSGLLSDSPIERGTLPGGVSGFDPQPTLTFEVVGRTSGTIGQSAGWYVALLDENGQEVSSVFFGAADSDYTIKTAAATWPTQDKRLATIAAYRIFGPEGELPGTFDMKKAYLKIRQTGEIKKTIGRVQMASKQSVTQTAWADIADVVVFNYSETEYKPAPTIRLRAGGRRDSAATSGQIRLVTLSGVEVAGSVLSFASTNSSVESGSLTLANATKYKIQS